jgi:internalin A
LVPSAVRCLSLAFHLREPVPGLVSALTVRLNEHDAGLHWRAGVFLRHPDPQYASEGLIELHGDRRLTIEVRAPEPNFFFQVLRGSVEHLLRVRWPGLPYDRYVPCPTGHGSPSPCEGRFRLDRLAAVRDGGTSTLTCQECLAVHDVAELLTGFPPAPGNGSDRNLEEQLDQIRRGLEQLSSHTADSAYLMGRILAVLGTETPDCPRLLTITRREPRGLERARPHTDKLRLTLWCEYPGAYHPWPRGTYDIEQPKDWARRVARYAKPVLSVLRVVVPAVGIFAGTTLHGDHLQAANLELDMMDSLISEMLDRSGEPARQSPTGELIAPPTAAALRIIRELLFKIDKGRDFGGLTRVRDPAGTFLWLCPVHAQEYDPGLPAIEPRPGRELER